ncbi:MAG: thymidylate synthase, partial [Lachnospiraceae bacterium]|nr:thymidylate synthase [Lachnospiraceae bacterium]
HIYDRHVDMIKELISRPAYDAPDFWFNPEKKSFYDFTKDDVRLDNYTFGEQLKNIPVAI